MNSVNSWADEFIDKLTYDVSAIERDPEACFVMRSLVEAESKIPDWVTFPTEMIACGCSQSLFEAFIKRLDLLEVKRTKAAELSAFLSIGSEDEGVMVAILLRRMLDLQTSWGPGIISASHVDLFFGSGVISHKAYFEMWSLQDVNPGFPLYNVTVKDF